MSIIVEKKFQLDSPVENVWSFIADPARVAVCLPGVELTEVVDTVTYAGNVRVKVGPMTVAYAGEAQLTERDEAARTFKMVGKGKEKGGAGSARMELMATIAEAGGGAEVSVKSTIDLTGKVVRFGRGMIVAVSDQLFEEFVANVRANLETEKALAPSPARHEPADAANAPLDEAPVRSELLPAPPPEAPGVPSERGYQPDAVLASKPSSSLAPASKPVAALPLFFKALMSMLKRFLSRILGRNRKPQE